MGSATAKKKDVDLYSFFPGFNSYYSNMLFDFVSFTSSLSSTRFGLVLDRDEWIGKRYPLHRRQQMMGHQY